MAEDTDAARDILAAEEFVVPAPDPTLHRGEARDVLAAEEFGMPAPDPVLQEKAPRDVLAAEEFGMGAPDPVLKVMAGGVDLPLPLNPADPSGSEPARDVLAAEEFAMPAADARAVPPDFSDEEPAIVLGPRFTLAALVLAAGVVLAVKRLRLRR